MVLEGSGRSWRIPESGFVLLTMPRTSFQERQTPPPTVVDERKDSGHRKESRAGWGKALGH